MLMEIEVKRMILTLANNMDCKQIDIIKKILLQQKEQYRKKKKKMIHESSLYQDLIPLAKRTKYSIQQEPTNTQNDISVYSSLQNFIQNNT